MTTIIETQATGKQIERLVDKILQALDGEDRAHGVMACMALALILTKEDITSEQIQEGIKGMSQYIVCFLGDPKGSTRLN